MLWTAVHYSVLIIFPLQSQKCEQKLPKLPKKTQWTRKRLMYFVVYLPNSAPKTADISQLSKPIHRLRYKWGQVSFTKYVFTNMWTRFTFLKRVWSRIFVLKFTFLPLLIANVRCHFGCWLRKLGSSFQQVVHRHLIFFFFFLDLMIYVWSFHDLTEYYYCILITWVLIYSYIRPTFINYFQIKAKEEK